MTARYWIEIVDLIGASRLVMQNCQALARQGIERQVTCVREGYLDTIRARINRTESFQIP
jgi:hypothetical protein